MDLPLLDVSNIMSDRAVIITNIQEVLTSREREIAVNRLEVDAGPATDTQFSWKECWDGVVGR